jgi:hypothetical protein
VFIYLAPYPCYDQTGSIMGLAQIDRTEHSAMPKMLNGKIWEEIKINIKTSFREFIDKEINNL